MVNDTIREGLKPYTIGEKIRSMRLKKSMGLVELGKHSGLSAALLSKIERGKLIPTLPTLLRVAMVFGVGLEFFFTDESQRHVVAIVRKNERIRLPERPGVGDIAYFFQSLDFKAQDRKLNAYFAEFEPVTTEKQRAHQHEGVEFIFVTEGKLGVRIGSEEHVLDEQDAMYFDSTVIHHYRRLSKKPCRAVLVTAQ